MYKKSQPYSVPPAQLGCNTWRVSAVWLDHFHPLHTAILGTKCAIIFTPFKYFCLYILQGGGLQREQLRRSDCAAAAAGVSEVSQLRLVPDQCVPGAAAAGRRGQVLRVSRDTLHCTVLQPDPSSIPCYDRDVQILFLGKIVTSREIIKVFWIK